MLYTDILKQILIHANSAHTICAFLKASKEVANQIRFIFLRNPFTAQRLACIGGGVEFLSFVVAISTNNRILRLKGIRRHLVNRAVITRSFEMYRDVSSIFKVWMTLNQYMDMIYDPHVIKSIKEQFLTHYYLMKIHMKGTTNLNILSMWNIRLAIEDKLDVEISNDGTPKFSFITGIRLANGLFNENNKYDDKHLIDYGIIPHNIEIVTLPKKLYNLEEKQFYFNNLKEGGNDGVYYQKQLFMRAIIHFTDDELLKCKLPIENLEVFEYLYNINYNKTANYSLKYYLCKVAFDKDMILQLIHSLKKSFNLNAILDINTIVNEAYIYRCAELSIDPEANPPFKHPIAYLQSIEDDLKNMFS